MLWCLDYENYLKTKKQTKENIDQIIISNIYYYNNHLEGLKNIFDSLAEDHKTIIVDLKSIDKPLVDFLVSYNETYPIFVRLTDSDCINLVFEKLPFFYDTPIENKETYNDFMENTTITDLYISGDLAFCMEHLRKPHKKKLRIIPCISQSCGLTNKLCDFFIRPEDIKLYEDFIDVMDLSFVSHGYLLADIYITQKKWIGDLSEIILGLPKGLNGDSIIPDFGYRRLNCEKRCQNLHGKCEICKRYAELSQNAKNNGIYFKA